MDLTKKEFKKEIKELGFKYCDMLRDEWDFNISKKVDILYSLAHKIEGSQEYTFTDRILSDVATVELNTFLNTYVERIRTLIQDKSLDEYFRFLRGEED